MKKLLLILLLLPSLAIAEPRKIESLLHWWEYSYDRGMIEFPTDPREDVLVQVIKRKGVFYWGHHKCTGDRQILCSDKRKVRGCALTAILRVNRNKREITLGERYTCNDGLLIIKRRGRY